VDRESYTTHDASGNGFTLATVRVVEDDFEEAVCVCVCVKRVQRMKGYLCLSELELMSSSSPLRERSALRET